MGLAILAGNLQDCGLSSRQKLMFMSSLAVLGAAIGLSSHFAGISDGLVFTLFAVLGAAYFLSIRRLAKATPENNATPDTKAA